MITNGDNFWLVIEEKHSSNEPAAFKVMKVIGSSGILDVAQSEFFEDIKEAESFVDADLDGDGKTGYSISDLGITWKPNEGTPEDGGDPDPTKLGTDEQGNLYIWDDEDGLIKVKDDRGNDFFLDESDEYGGNWSRESVQATWDDTAEKYLIAAKETFVEIWDGQETTQQSWLIFEVDEDGKTSWESMKWNVNIADYEQRFNFDLNNDGDLGINLDKLVVIETDDNWG